MLDFARTGMNNRGCKAYYKSTTYERISSADIRGCSLLAAAKVAPWVAPSFLGRRTGRNMASHSPRGRRWTVKELEALPAAWKGDFVRDGDGLVGDVRLGSDQTVSIHWRWEFKWEGKKARHYCGTWPATTMEAVRAERDRARQLRTEGVDPRVERKASRIEAQQKLEAVIEDAARRAAENKTWREMVEDWLANGVKRAGSNAELRAGFERHLLPSLGDMQARTVEESNLRETLRRVGRELELARTAERMAGDLRQMYRWAIVRKPWRDLLRDGNPADLLETEQVVPEGYEPGIRERKLSDDELRELRDIFQRTQAQYLGAEPGAKYTVARPLGRECQLAVWLCLGTLCRIGELVVARWEHVDLQAGVWFVPAKNTKTKVDWTVYLSSFALQRFKALHTLTGKTPFCFPTRPRGRARDGAQEPATKPLGTKVITKQIGDRQHRFMKRKDPSARRRNDNTLVLADGANGEWTPHDMRRTGATMMQSLGVQPEIIDRCQNHKMPGDDAARALARVRPHYQQYNYEPEKRAAWEKLGAHLDAILASKYHAS